MQVRGANCAHVFHLQCLARWVGSQRELMREDEISQPESCPLCRVNLFREIPADTDETGIRNNQDQLGEEGMQRSETINTPEEPGASDDQLRRALRDVGISPHRSTEDERYPWLGLGMVVRDVVPNLSGEVRNEGPRVEQQAENHETTPRPYPPPTRGMFRQGRRLFFT